jgi:predicted RNA-binding protein YlxR (DUF448 family)
MRLTRQRTCVSCRSTQDKRRLVRFVRTSVSDAGCPQGPGERRFEVQIDESGKKAGRGAYLCASPECFAAARRGKKLDRALRCGLDGSDYQRLEIEFISLCAPSQTVGTE